VLTSLAKRTTDCSLPGTAGVDALALGGERIAYVRAADEDQATPRRPSIVSGEVVAWSAQSAPDHANPPPILDVAAGLLVVQLHVHSRSIWLLGSVPM